MTHDTTKEGATTMTDATTLQTLITEAESDLTAAIRWAGTTDPHAPLALKVRDQERIERARVELDALRELEPEGKTMTTTMDRDALITEVADIRDEMEQLGERFYRVMSEVRRLPGGQHTWDRVDAYPGLRLDRDMGAGSNAIDWIDEVNRFLEEG